MKTPIALSRLTHQQSAAPRKPVPVIVSPVDTAKAEQRDEAADATTEDVFDRNRSNDVTPGHSGDSSTKHVIYFKPRHESTTIELFYDLFFVANLTIFTENNEIEDVECR